MFIDNVTSIILFALVTIMICRRLGISPVPILMSEALLSDTGGVSTPIGDPAKEILKFSDEKGFNLIIMCATGKGTISIFLLGSVSRKVVIFSRYATIIVPHREE